jgi:chorismate mutase
VSETTNNTTGPVTGSASGAAGATTADGDAGTLIAASRLRIDDLDARIIALVRERMAVSGEIQSARIGSGGRRVHLARELEVLRTYGDALGGRPGTAVAMTLLELCRGRV